MDLFGGTPVVVRIFWGFFLIITRKKGLAALALDVLE